MVAFVERGGVDGVEVLYLWGDVVCMGVWYLWCGGGDGLIFDGG